jgi:replicative DNA helicase
VASVAQVMSDVDREFAAGDASRLRALATGFQPLDEVLNGGLRPGELLVVGGPTGVGKTIFGLQVARNVVLRDPEAAAMVVCYEHDRAHLLSRLLCLESAECGDADSALTLRRLAQMAVEDSSASGLLARLRASPRHAAAVAALDGYGERLLLVKASGATSTLEQVAQWAQELETMSSRALLVVDYLQKIPVRESELQPETEVTTHLMQGLKDLAMSTGLRMLAIAASDREGLKAKRMRLADLRGSSALQYEADVGLVLNNKYDIVSREHLVYNIGSAEAMRGWVVMSVEKNRAGRTAVDMEHLLDAPHFRLVSKGEYVRDRLIDEKVVLA